MSSEGTEKVRVLVVDDSSLVRTILRNGLSADPEIEVIATARDPYEARDILVRERPDVMTLDVEMPRMDGVTFLRKFMAVLPTPTVVLSSLTSRGTKLSVEALEAGAVDVLAKPSSGVAGGLDGMMKELRKRVKAAARVRVSARTSEVAHVNETALSESTDRVIALGASTGGVAALTRILPAFPRNAPGIVIVQHMPAGFTRDFADRLSGLCKMTVREAVDGDRVLLGQILVAPGGTRHLEVRRFGGEYRVKLEEGPPVSGHVPSVDRFFSSVAKYVGPNAVACLLTGMGEDGARGLLHVRAAGGRTFAQDEATCAVWGMPAAAAHLGAAEALVPLHEIPLAVLTAHRARRSAHPAPPAR
jgi:two-component system chemotaxis response regulator CheB